MEDELVFCDDINGLLNAMGCEYEPDEWRLFIDISKRSLKCVLLHNGDEFASIPTGHSFQMKQSYNSMKQVLEKLKYSENNWKICRDLKIMCMLLGQQGESRLSLFVGQPCKKGSLGKTRLAQTN